MNSKYIRVGCLVLSIFLFLFSGWMRIKGDYRSMWKTGITEMMNQYTQTIEGFSAYGDLLGGGMDMDVLKDLEKFVKRIEDGKMTPLEAAWIAPKVNDILDIVSMMSGSGSEDLEDVVLVLKVYAVLFWVAMILGIASLAMALFGKGKILNVFYMILLILIWIMFVLICTSANDSADQSIMGTGFWSILSIILAIAALCFKSNSAKAHKAAAVPPYGMGMPGIQQNPMNNMQGGFGNQGGFRQAVPQNIQPQGWNCPTCGKPQLAESRFCAVCGTPKPQVQPQPVVQPQMQMPQGWNCPTCGSQQVAESRFCAVCGTPKPQVQQATVQPVEMQRMPVESVMPPVMQPAEPQKPKASFCKECGAELLPEDKFCPECGTPRS